MEFVVKLFTNHLKLSRKDVIKYMLATHEKGGIMIPLNDLASAEILTRSITSETIEHNHKLVCRVVTAHQVQSAGIEKDADQ